jgi:hypothetical protein
MALFEIKDKTKSLAQLYPELGKMSEFKNITVKESHFVWYYACKDSPCIDIKDDFKRAASAYYESFGEGSDSNHKELYLSLRFPSNVKIAIDRMSKFIPDVRSQAKTAIGKTVDNMIKILNYDVDGALAKINDDGVAYADWQSINAWASSIQKIREELPSAITQLEEGFGASNKSSTAGAGKSPIQSVIAEDRKQI